VTGASLNSSLPMSGNNWSTYISIAGIDPPPENQPRISNRRIISNDYFRDMDIPLLSGRNFLDTDQVNSQKVMVINQRLAEAFWPDEDPIGRRIALVREPTMEDWHEIVGVVGDVRQGGLTRPIAWCVYMPMTQMVDRRNFLLVSTAGDPHEMVASVRNTVWSVDDDLPIPEVITMRLMMRRSDWEAPLYTIMFGVFSVIALLLASVGVYGVIAYSVTQRKREFGIRMALGADRRMVQKLVVGKGILLGGVGLLIGLGGAYMTMSVLESLLYGVSRDDLVIYVLTALLMTGVALMASWLPARRAGQVDPVESLRVE